MMTAVDIMRDAVARTDVALRAHFGVQEAFIHFESGYTPTIVNSLTQLIQGSTYTPYPLVAVFTEGMVEMAGKGCLDFTIPKAVIAVRATGGLTEAQRLETSFDKYLHPIFSELERQLASVHFGYGFTLARSDVPYYSESGKKASTFNDMLDGIIIRDIRMRVLNGNRC